MDKGCGGLRVTYLSRETINAPDERMQFDEEGGFSVDHIGGWQGGRTVRVGCQSPAQRRSGRRRNGELEGLWVVSG